MKSEYIFLLLGAVAFTAAILPTVREDDTGPPKAEINKAVLHEINPAKTFELAVVPVPLASELNDEVQKARYEAFTASLAEAPTSAETPRLPRIRDTERHGRMTPAKPDLVVPLNEGQQ